MKAPTPYQASGHTDLFIEKKKRLRVVEAKTIASESFKKLVAPLVEHSWQIQFYMWSAGKDKKLKGFRKKIDDRVGYVFYVSKGAIYRDLPIKMFVVERDDYLIDKIKAKLGLYVQSVKNNVLPPVEKKCLKSEFTSFEATSCPCMEICKEWSNGKKETD